MTTREFQSGSGQGGDRFVWPPATEQADAPGDTAPTPRRAEPPEDAAGAGSLIESIEDTFLGVHKRSFAIRARAEGWSPTPDDEYCWRCGGSVGAHEADADGCAACRQTKLAWGRFVRLGEYGGLLKSAIGDLKFHRWRRNGTEIGRLLGRRIAEQLDRTHTRPESAAIVPVPMPFRRRMVRGVDHTLVLARAAGEAAGVGIVCGLDCRFAPSQVGLTPRQRAMNAAGMFARRTGFRGPPDGVLIVLDDIRTTGATLTAACKAIRGVRRGRAGGDIPAERVWAAGVAVTKHRGKERF